MYIVNLLKSPSRAFFNAAVLALLIIVLMLVWPRKHRESLDRKVSKLRQYLHIGVTPAALYRAMSASISIELSITAPIAPLCEQRLAAVFTNPSPERELFNTIEFVAGEIKAGERIKLTIPRSYSHDSNGEYNWDHIEEVQMAIRGHMLRPDVFATLRFDRYRSPHADVVIDIGHM